MKSDRDKWNLRYQDSEYQCNQSISKLVKDYSNIIPDNIIQGGKALDIACGKGHNSLFLAKKGFMVDAVDISDIAIKGIVNLHPNINPMCRDLDDWKIPKNSYNLIINIRFLDRRLFKGIKKGLIRGGLLLFESFTGENNDPFCLRENELVFAFKSLRIIYYKEQKTNASKRFKQMAFMAAIKK